MMMASVGGLSMLELDTPSSKSLGYESLVEISVCFIWQTGNAVMSRLVREIRGFDKNNLAEGVIQRCTKWVSSVLHLVSQLFGVSVALSCAGCVFRSVGFSKQYESISGLGKFSSGDIRDALAGVDSSILEAGQDPCFVGLDIKGITETISNTQWVAFARGGMTLSSGLV
ncbi:hypothetical protein CCMA1212_010810 [Trichoderma ghanense]|uniref:Uncharacterized protein n=1 Tax=Trichoderma ghanense TaxID=65468 RepID=A0ABY2GP82_9HYPO